MAADTVRIGDHVAGSPAPTQAAALDLVVRIERALAAAGRVVAAVAPADLARPTPCPDWDVRALLAHLVGGVAEMATMVGTEPGGRDATVAVDHLDPASAWAAAAAADRTAWRRADALEGTVTFSFATLPAPLAAMIHLTELTVHPIDLAVAIGQEELIDQDLAIELLRSMHELGGIDGFRVPGMFGAELAAEPGAPAHRRLLAYVGRAA